MKRFTQLLSWSCLLVGLVAARVQAQQINLDIRNAGYSQSSSMICFDVYISAGTGYDGTTTPWIGLQIRLDFLLEVTSGTPVFGLGTYSNVNTTYVQGTLGQSIDPPGPPTTGYNYEYGLTLARSTGNPNLPATPVLLFHYCIPVTGGTFNESAANDEVIIRQTDTDPGPAYAASFWNYPPSGTTPRFFGNEVEPLPIELITFEPRSDKCEVYLYWQTASEHNFGYYEIQGSKDGRVFKAIGQQKPVSSSSSTVRTYRYEVPKAYQGYYFRLKLVDLDQTYEYSPVVVTQVACDKAYAVQVYPNPNYLSQLTVELSSPVDKEQVQWLLLDSFGKRLRQGKVALRQGSNLWQVPTQDLPSGSYFIQIIGIEQLSSPFKFIKSNF